MKPLTLAPIPDITTWPDEDLAWHRTFYTTKAASDVVWQGRIDEIDAEIHRRSLPVGTCPRCGDPLPADPIATTVEPLCDSCAGEYHRRSAALVSLGWRHGAPYWDVDRWFHKIEEAFRDEQDDEPVENARPRIIAALSIFPYSEPDWTIALAVDATSDELADVNAAVWTRIPWRHEAHRYRFTEWDAIARISDGDESIDYLVRFDRQEDHDDR